MSTVFRSAVPALFAALACCLITSCEAGIEPGQRNNPYDPHGTNFGANPPAVRLLSPSNGEVLPSYFWVRGDAADDLGLSNVHITVAGIVVSLPVSGTNAVWSNNFNSIAIGDTVIEVYSEDFGGNKSPKVSVNVTIDASLPSVDISYPPDGFITRMNPVTLLGSMLVSSPYSITNFAIETNGAGWAALAPTNVWNYQAALLDGTNAFRARVIATSKRTNITPLVHVILDTNPPSVSFINLTNYQYCPDNFDFKGTVFDQYAGVSNICLSVDGGPFIALALTGGGNFLTNISLGGWLGLHTNYYYAIDNLGNTSATNKLIVDHTDALPVITVLYPPATFFTNVYQMTVYGSNSVGAFFSITNMIVRVNGGTWSNVGSANPSLTSWSNAVGLNSGDTTTVDFIIYASSGMTNAASRQINCDDWPPEVNFDTPETYTNIAGIPVSVTEWDDWSGIRTNFYSVNGGPAVGYDGVSFTATGMTSNTNTISVWAVDYAGNCSGTNNLTCYYDTNPPALTVTNPVADYAVVGGAAYMLQGTFSDNYGVSWLYFDVNGLGFNTVSVSGSWSADASILPGTNDIWLYVADFAGNPSATNHFHLIRSTNLYVSTNGSDTNSGLVFDRPLSNIQTALNLAPGTAITNILVGAGVYTNNKGLNPTMAGFIARNYPFRLTGGWNPAFTARSGMSELDGGGVLYHVAYLSNMNGGLLDGFVLRGGKAYWGYVNYEFMGGGLILETCKNLLITNLIVSNNQALEGGGIYLAGSGNCITADVYKNIASNYGGGYFLSSGSNMISGNITYNQVLGSTGSGGGICIYMNSDTNLISALAGNNFANYEGGGISIINGKNNLITGPVMSNTSGDLGGGLYLESACTNTISNIIAYNSASSGAGLSAYYSYGNILFSTITSNTAASQNGGMALIDSAYNTVSCGITSNSAPAAPGIYFAGTHDNAFNCLIGFNNGNNALRSILSFNDTVSCVLTNNSSTPAYLQDCTNLNFIQSVFSAAPGSGFTAIIVYDVPGIRLVSNTFVSNGFGYFFQDTLTNRTVTNNGAWTNINKPSFTGATADSTNNVKF